MILCNSILFLHSILSIISYGLIQEENAHFRSFTNVFDFVYNFYYLLITYGSDQSTQLSH